MSIIQRELWKSSPLNVWCAVLQITLLKIFVTTIWRPADKMCMYRLGPSVQTYFKISFIVYQHLQVFVKNLRMTTTSY